MVSFEDCSRSINVMIKCLLFQKILASLISPHFPHNGHVLTSKISSKLVAYCTQFKTVLIKKNGRQFLSKLLILVTEFFLIFFSHSSSNGTNRSGSIDPSLKMKVGTCLLFAKFLRTTFLQSTSERVLLEITVRELHIKHG